MSWELASFLDPRRRPARRLRLVRALAAALAGRRPGRRAGGAGDRRPGRLRRLPQRQADHRHRHLRRLRARRRSRLRGRRPHRAGLQLLVRPGAVDALADGGLGALRRSSAPRWRSAVATSAAHPRRRLRLRRRRLRRSAELLADGDLRRGPVAAALRSCSRARAIPFDARPRDRQRRPRPARRPGDGADAGPLPRALRVGPRRAERRPARRQAAPPAAGLGPGLRERRRRGASCSSRSCSAPWRRRAQRPLRGRRRRRSGCARSQNDDGGLGASPGDDSGAGDDRLGDAGTRGGRPQPARRRRRAAAPRSTSCAASVSTLKSPGDLARTILALEGAGVDPRQFGGDNLVAELLGKRRANGSFEGWPDSTAFAVIALRTAGATGGLDETRSPGCARSRTTTVAGATCPARPAPPMAPAP